ncbi:MAG: pyridoxamine 5'-phosphate oxidase [Actinomycetes bacterium]
MDVSKPAREVDLAAWRQEYAGAGLTEADLAPDPFGQFGAWLDQVAAAGVAEPNAMVVATADAGGRPSARTVLLKSVDPRGFVFYTNYHSRKGREVAGNPRASLVFPWFALARQVVVIGDVEYVERSATAAYFHSRPRGSQLGAWATEQSAVIASRSVIEARYARAEARWAPGTPIPVPENWGGLRVVPLSVEFWQGRADRLHDRLRYRRVAGDQWAVERLSP